MKNTFYIFGDFGHGYNQYPYDGAEVTFRRVATVSSRRQQCFVRRNGDSLYYGIMHRLDSGSGQYVGLGLLVKGVMMRDVRPLMRQFEDMIENMVISDQLIGFDDHQHLVARVQQLIECRAELSRLQDVMDQRLDDLESFWRTLPQLHIALDADEIRNVSRQADADEIARACSMNGYVLLNPVSNPEHDEEELLRLTARLNDRNREIAGLQQTLREKDHLLQDNEQALRQKDEDLRHKDETLRAKDTEIKSLRRRQPSAIGRFFKVLLILALLGGGSWYAYSHMGELERFFADPQAPSDRLTETNHSLQQAVTDLQEELRDRDEQLDALSDRLALQDTIITALMDQSNIRQPMVTTSMFITRDGNDSYGSASVGSEVRLGRGAQLHVHLRYIGIRQGTARVQLRTTTPGDTWWFITAPHTQDYNIAVRPGSHVYDFERWQPSDNGYWEPGKYIVELLLDGVCVQRREFTVKQ